EHFGAGDLTAEVHDRGDSGATPCKNAEGRGERVSTDDLRGDPEISVRFLLARSGKEVGGASLNLDVEARGEGNMTAERCGRPNVVEVAFEGAIVDRSNGVDVLRRELQTCVQVLQVGGPDDWVDAVPRDADDADRGAVDILGDVDHAELGTAHLST